MSEIGEWLAAVMRATATHQEGIDAAYQQLVDLRHLSRVTAHRYICAGGCGVLATVVNIGGTILLRTRDYKPSLGLNRGRSVEAARKKNTLDGERHWPPYLIDLNRDSGHPGAHIEVVCKHGPKRIEYDHALAQAKCVRPGHPGKPTLL